MLHQFIFIIGAIIEELVMLGLNTVHNNILDKSINLLKIKDPKADPAVKKTLEEIYVDFFQIRGAA